MSLVTRRARQAFTLVELLVVIGIIAVLISILLPSLARARQQANMVSCLSNLRQIGQTLQLYTNDNKGFLPYGRGPNNTGAPLNKLYVTLWTHELTTILGKDVGTDGMGLAPVFRCPEALLPSGISDDNFKFHYSVNPRLMPDANVADISHGQTRPAMRRQLATVNGGTEKMLVWDGGQVTADVGTGAALSVGAGNNNANPYSGGLDGNAWTNAASHHFCDPPDDGMNLDTKIGIGANVAYVLNVDAAKQSNLDNNLDPGVGNENATAMRFRHIGNTQMGALFCDGHAEQRTINAVTRREVCVNWK